MSKNKQYKIKLTNNREELEKIYDQFLGIIANEQDRPSIKITLFKISDYILSRDLTIDKVDLIKESIEFIERITESYDMFRKRDYDLLEFFQNLCDAARFKFNLESLLPIISTGNESALGFEKYYKKLPQSSRINFINHKASIELSLVGHKNICEFFQENEYGKYYIEYITIINKAFEIFKDTRKISESFRRYAFEKRFPDNSELSEICTSEQQFLNNLKSFEENKKVQQQENLDEKLKLFNLNVENGQIIQSLKTYLDIIISKKISDNDSVSILFYLFKSTIHNIEQKKLEYNSSEHEPILFESIKIIRKYCSSVKNHRIVNFHGLNKYKMPYRIDDILEKLNVDERKLRELRPVDIEKQKLADEELFKLFLKSNENSKSGKHNNEVNKKKNNKRRKPIIPQQNLIKNNKFSGKNVREVIGSSSPLNDAESTEEFTEVKSVKKKIKNSDNSEILSNKENILNNQLPKTSKLIPVDKKDEKKPVIVEENNPLLDSIKPVHVDKKNEEVISLPNDKENNQKLTKKLEADNNVYVQQCVTYVPVVVVTLIPCVTNLINVKILDELKKERDSFDGLTKNISLVARQLKYIVEAINFIRVSNFDTEIINEFHLKQIFTIFSKAKDIIFEEFKNFNSFQSNKKYNFKENFLHLNSIGKELLEFNKELNEVNPNYLSESDTRINLATLPAHQSKLIESKLENIMRVKERS